MAGTMKRKWVVPTKAQRLAAVRHARRLTREGFSSSRAKIIQLNMQVIHQHPSGLGKNSSHLKEMVHKLSNEGLLNLLMVCLYSLSPNHMLTLQLQV